MDRSRVLTGFGMSKALLAAQRLVISEFDYNKNGVPQRSLRTIMYKVGAPSGHKYINIIHILL